MFAAQPKILDDRLLLATGLLIATLLVGAMLLGVIDRWRKRHMSRDDSAESLTSYRALYEQGEITKEEYEQIRARVAARARERLAVKRPSQTEQSPEATPSAPPRELPLQPDD